MTPFIQTLFTMTAAATVAAVVVMILRLPLKKAPRWITCALWLVVFLRMVCPVSLDLPVSLMPAQVTSGAAAERVLPAPAPTPLEPTKAVTEPPLESSKAVEPTEPMAPTPNGPDRYAVLTLIWAAGAAGMGLWAVASYLRLRRRVADAVLVTENVYETDRVDSPFVCGVFNPRIYLPVGLAEEDKAYVLLHEQAHLRRRDHLTKPLGWLALCIHWFNPVLWVAYRLFCRDVEAACDQSVVKDFDKTDTAGYAAALLHLGRKPSLPQAVPLAFGEENAKGRIQGVLNYKKPAFWVVILAVILCLVCGVLLLADQQQAPESDPLSQLESASFEGAELYPNSLAENLCHWTPEEGGSRGYMGQVLFPNDLFTELISVLSAQEHEDYQEFPHLGLSTAPILGRIDAIRFGTADLSIYYSLMQMEDGRYCLYRFDETEDTLQIAYYPNLANAPDFQAWESNLEEYLTVDLPDQLYALRVDSAKDAGPILEALQIFMFFSYTTESADGNLTIRVEDACTQTVIEHQRDQYLGWASLRIIDLVEDIGTVTWVYPATEELPQGCSWQITGNGKPDSAGEFRLRYNSERTILD